MAMPGLLLTLVISTLFLSHTVLATSVGQGENLCKITCDKRFFDIGKDCVDAPSPKCQCVAHCCWAFDCRLWPAFARCRKKCQVTNWQKFGAPLGPVKCDHFRCQDSFLLDWDIRGVEDPKQINCISHCCYAFNCKRYGGFCRELCNT